MSENDEIILSCIASLYHEDSSSLELDLTHWREALKAEIEKDIEEQVRLKLGLNTAPNTPQSHASGSTMSATLFRGLQPSTRTHLPPLQTYPQPPSLQSHVQCSSSVICLKDHDETSSWSSTKPKKAVHFSPKKLSSKRELRTTCSECFSPDVLKYINSKYGTPLDQLDNLQQVGKFHCTEFDSSGNKTGPVINYPPEAGICVPTPMHVNTATTCHNKQINTIHSNSMSELPSGYSEFPAELTSVSEKKIVFNKDEFQQSTDIFQSGGYPRKQDGGHHVLKSTDELKFESRFESGNLQQVFKLSENEYELKLCPDLYSKKHTQWFYFSIEGMSSNVEYTFHITNFKKSDSLYNYGMKLLLYSVKEAELGSDAWKRVGTNIRYCRCHGDEYALSWTMEFPHNEDRCYLCYCYPYHYSQLLRYLNELEQCPQRSCYLKREILCKTLAGNTCPLLTITNFQCAHEELQRRPGVIVSARVHPGESNSSWVMEGFIDFLTSEANHAKNLRNHFIFLLIPMLNPDGVIVGNYRTSLGGVDLNRVYKNPHVNLFPTVYHTKMLIQSTMQQRKLLVYVDLHGHSRKHNVFMYGCHAPKCDHIQFLNERVIPFLLSQQVPEMFSFESCKFNVQRCKESTGRVVTWKMGVGNSFTMEATFCGSTLGKSKLHFQQNDLLSIGHGLGEAIYYYHQFLRSKSYQQKVLSQLAEYLMSSKAQFDKKERSLNNEPLPDVVTSTTFKQQTDSKFASNAKRYRSKSLRKFMRCNMDILEEESSTSGSDSENDEFSFQSKKTVVAKSHKKKRASAMTLQARTQVHLPHLIRRQQQYNELSTQRGASQSPRVHSLHVLASKPPLTTSAPVKITIDSNKETRRQSGVRLHYGGNWRFINRYKDRSNGGIPMFSEERCREREALRKQQSLGMLTAQGTTREMMEGKIQDDDQKQCHSNNQTQAKHKTNVLWKPINYHEELAGSRQSQEVKGYCNNRGPIHLSNGVGKILDSTRNERYHISPRLAKFISEMWSNINDQQKHY